MAKKSSLAKSERKNEIQAYMLIILQLIGFVVFSIYPIIWVFRYAFYDYDGITATFCGLENFVRAFTRDSLYWQSVVNTFIIAYGKLILEIPLAFLTALALSNGMMKFRRIFMVGFYLPKMTGIAVNCLIFSYLFATFNGPVNNVLQSLGIFDTAVNWLGEKWASILVIMLQSVWVGFSTNMLYFMAGISSVSEECIEAAKVDGANSFQIFFKITIPMLAPVLRTIVMLAMVGGMKVYEDVMLLTNGANNTNVVMLYLYQKYFEFGTQQAQYGYASALGVITTVIIGVVTVIYLKLSQKADQVY